MRRVDYFREAFSFFLCNSSEQSVKSCGSSLTMLARSTSILQKLHANIVWWQSCLKWWWSSVRLVKFDSDVQSLWGHIKAWLVHVWRWVIICGRVRLLWTTVVSGLDFVSDCLLKISDFDRIESTELWFVFWDCRDGHGGQEFVF